MDNNKNKIEELVAESEGGLRTPQGFSYKILFFVPLVWSLFQVWYASPLPFEIGFGVFNDTQARSIHLAFALFLAFLAYPASANSPRDSIPLLDWGLALLGAFCAAYIYLFYEQLAERSGAPILFDMVVGITGLIILLEATRRALGLPLTIVALVFLTYTYFGPYMPDVIAHKGQSLSKIVSHQWLTTEGVFGIALGVSTSFVFLFVLFGAMLEKAGAGNYFIKSAFAFLGHMRGGPAKAAVAASAATGLISGSSIANVATTGIFTIPLMKRVGFPGSKAGAIEVAASTNGQLTPPVMGAAAFLMVEYVGISYIDVIRHAILPALISYIALFYIVHLEAVKANMQGLARRENNKTATQKLLVAVGVFSELLIIGLVVYYGIGWIKDIAGHATIYIIPLLIFLSYLILIKFSSGYPELEVDDPNDPIDKIPEIGPTVKAGIYYLLPITVMMWCLIVERFSPGLSAFWATLFMLFIVLTQRPLTAYFRQKNTQGVWSKGFDDCLKGLSHGARNMIPIGVATAAAGIVVGTITLTGIGQVLIEFVEFISGGVLILALLFTALICIILGMGLPTTANYIVVSSLMAPVLVSIASSNGLVVPLIAVHMFVFYFGILADDTPPVGLAAFAAAAIAKSDPIKTGVQGFFYDIRTAILPFLFIFNTQLLLIGINSWIELLMVILSATAAMLLFAAATQGYWLCRNKIWETIALLLIAFTLFRPGFWWDEIYPPVNQIDAIHLFEQAEKIADNGNLKMLVSGENLNGDLITKTVTLALKDQAEGRQRLMDVGLEIRNEGDKVIVDNVGFDSPAQKVGLDFDWQILKLKVEVERPAKQWMFVPALILLGVIAMVQIQRRKRSLSC